MNPHKLPKILDPRWNDGKIHASEGCYYFKFANYSRYMHSSVMVYMDEWARERGEKYGYMTSWFKVRNGKEND